MSVTLASAKIFGREPSLSRRTVTEDLAGTAL
jgi:hypothetical protein